MSREKHTPVHVRRSQSGTLRKQSMKTQPSELQKLCSELAGNSFAQAAFCRAHSLMFPGPIILHQIPPSFQNERVAQLLLNLSKYFVKGRQFLAIRKEEARYYCQSLTMSELLQLLSQKEQCVVILKTTRPQTGKTSAEKPNKLRSKSGVLESSKAKKPSRSVLHQSVDSPRKLRQKAV